MLVRDVILLLCKAGRPDSGSTGDDTWPGLAGLTHSLSLSPASPRARLGLS